MSSQHARHVAIYTRISDDKEKDQKGVARQKAECEQLVSRLQENGAIPADLRIEHYCDPSISAYQTVKKREHFERMLQDVQNGYVEVIVAYHSDRLYRRVQELYRVAELVKDNTHLTVQTVKSGLVDFSTPSGRLAAGMLALIAQYEVELKSDRQRSQSDAVAASGKSQRGGSRPFGYQLSDEPEAKERRYKVVVEEEAHLVRDATSRLLGGESVSSILRDWNLQKVRPVRGGKWHHSSFVALMTRYRNAGIRQHRGEPLGAGDWPAIVDPSDFEDLRKILLDPARLTAPDKTRKHLLSFILTCGNCGNGLRRASVKSRNRKYYTYQCPGLDQPCRLAIMEHIAEKTVRVYLADRLTTPDAALLEINEAERHELRELRVRRAELDKDERQIESSKKAKKISPTTALRMLEEIHAMRTRLDGEVASISQRVTLASLLTESAPGKRRKSGRDIRKSGRDVLGAEAEARAKSMAHFDTLSLAQRREIVRSLCAITIEPAIKGISYKNGKSFERVLIYPRNPMTGELACDPIRGSEIVGIRDQSGRMVGFQHSDPEASKA